MRSSAEADFSQRVSPQDLPELMDGDCSYEDFRDCLRSLEQVNRWFLGYRPTLSWLEKLPLKPPHPVSILDIGSGGGDLLRQIALWARRRDVPVQLTGIDLNPFAARASAEFTPDKFGISWITGNALLYSPERPIDIVVSSLMTHHLEDVEVITLLRWMEANAQAGWFINDLARSQRSYTLFAWAAKVAGWHRFVRHDGPASFRRAFSEADWIRLLQSADIPRESISLEHWRPGRLCLGHWM